MLDQRKDVHDHCGLRPRGVHMLRLVKAQTINMLLTLSVLGGACGPAAAAVRIEGQVQAGGGALANSTVTLWATSAAEPKQLAQAKTGRDGRFQLGSEESVGTDVILYIIAKGGEAARTGSGD